MYIHIFYKQCFYKQHQVKLAKNQAKARQHPEAKLLLIESHLLSSSMLSFKTTLRYSKNVQKTSVSFNEIIWLIIMKIRVKMKNRSHRYDINGTRVKHG